MRKLAKHLFRILLLLFPAIFILLLKFYLNLRLKEPIDLKGTLIGIAVIYIVNLMSSAGGVTSVEIIYISLFVTIPSCFSWFNGTTDMWDYYLAAAAAGSWYNLVLWKIHWHIKTSDKNTD